MLINVDKYRALNPSEGREKKKKKTSNFIYLLTKLITIPTFVKKRDYAPTKLAAATVLEQPPSVARRCFNARVILRRAA